MYINCNKNFTSGIQSTSEQTEESQRTWRQHKGKHYRRATGTKGASGTPWSRPACAPWESQKRRKKDREIIWIIVENLPNLMKDKSKHPKAQRTLRRKSSETHTKHIIIELLKAKDDESFENSERQLVTCKGSSVRSSADTLEKRQGAGIFKVLEGRAVIRGSYIWQNRPSEAKEQRGHWGSSDELPQPQGMLQGSWGRGKRARDTNSKPQGGIETPGKVNKWVIVKASIILTLVCDSIFYAV